MQTAKLILKKTKAQIDAIRLLSSNAIHIMLYGGARSGKTLIILFAILYRACKRKSRHVIFRKHFNSAKTSVLYETWENLKSFLPCKKWLDEHIILSKSDWVLKFPNGSEIWIAGLDDKERTDKVLGKEYSTIFFSECSEMSYDSIETALSRLAENSGLALKVYYDENPPLKRHWSYQLFVLKKNPMTQADIPNPDNYACMRLNPTDNEENLPSNYIPDVLGMMSERKRKRFLKGEFGDDVEGALWNSDMIEAYRVSEHPELKRIVVGVDPSVTSSEKADETGIVSVGLGIDNHYYVIDDRSLKSSPQKWGEAAIAAYKVLQADRVIGETNNGGELVEMNLRNIDPTVSYKSVHASRGKIIRAEPISALYEQGLVHHVGQYPLLEDEMCSYTGDKSEDSPNHMDALVWAMTELGVHNIDPHVTSAIDNRPPVEHKLDDEIERLTQEILADPDLTEQEKLDSIAEVERM